MNTGKPTPGPWTANLAGAHGNHAGGFSVETADGIVICGRAGWPSRAAESHANARLIAAAPDLLKALMALVYVAPEKPFSMRDPRYEAWPKMLKAGRAAIAKAEGR